MVSEHSYNIDEVRRVMEANGIRRLETSFEGGNDSGSIDDVRATYADGTQRVIEYAYPWDYDFAHSRYEKVKSVVDPEAAADNRIWELVAQPIDLEYGSWAGSWSTSGRVIFDLDAEQGQQIIVEDYYSEDYDEDWEDEDDETSLNPDPAESVSGKLWPARGEPAQDPSDSQSDSP